MLEGGWATLFFSLCIGVLVGTTGGWSLAMAELIHGVSVGLDKALFHFVEDRWDSARARVPGLSGAFSGGVIVFFSKPARNPLSCPLTGLTMARNNLLVGGVQLSVLGR